jgi:hypothetical protein
MGGVCVVEQVMHYVYDIKSKFLAQVEVGGIGDGMRHGWVRERGRLSRPKTFKSRYREALGISEKVS